MTDINDTEVTDEEIEILAEFFNKILQRKDNDNEQR